MELRQFREEMRKCEAVKKRLLLLAEVSKSPTISFPFKARQLGWPLLTIHSKEELEGRIRELSELANWRLVEGVADGTKV